MFWTFQNVNRIESSTDLKPAVYNEPENSPNVAPPKVLQVQQVQHYEEFIENPNPTQRIQRRNNNGTSSAFCCCFLTLLTLVFIFLCFLAYRKHIHLNGELRDFKSIKQIELRSTNLPSQPNLRGGTVILHAQDGSTGIIDQSSFSLMAVSFHQHKGNRKWSVHFQGQVACTSALKSSSRSSFLDLYGNYSILGITKNNLFAATDCPKFKVTNLKCNGREKSIEQCSYTLKYASCSDLNEAAGVACKRHSGRGVTSQVSVLLGGKDHYEGDIMALNEQLVLGPVCDVGFGYNEVINVSDVSDRSGLPRKCKEFYSTHCGEIRIFVSIHFVMVLTTHVICIFL